MAELNVSATADIAAPAEAVYGLLADYRTGHPAILPPEHFPALEIEAGAVGAGTIIRVTTRTFGLDRHFRMTVAEPEPGRVLTETDTETGMVTSFTVVPIGPDRSRLTIATRGPLGPGPAGWLNARLAPIVLRRIFRKQLALVNQVLAARPPG